MPEDKAVKAIIEEVKGIQKAGVPVDIGATEDEQQAWAESAYAAMKETERKHKEKEAAAIAKEAAEESKQLAPGT